MHRRRFFLGFVLLAGGYLFAAWRVSADDVPTPTDGLRVFYTGHSFHMFVPARIEQLAKAAAIDYQLAGKQGIGGSKVIQHWELAEDKNQAKAALTSGKVDVFTMACHLLIPDPGIDNFTELGLKHNPNLRLVVQCSWVPFDLTSIDLKSIDLKSIDLKSIDLKSIANLITNNSQRDATDLDALQAFNDQWRKQVEAQVDALNTKYGKRAVEIVPVGDAVMRLRKLVAAGEFPGVAKQSELFRDTIGHGLAHVQALAAYCNFAVIYRRNPQGLKVEQPDIDVAQDAILQRIAWETVVNYPYAGIKGR